GRRRRAVIPRARHCASGGAVRRMSATLREVEPTVFFTRDDSGALRQRALLHLDHAGPAGELHVCVRAPGRDGRAAPGRVEAGPGVYPCAVPDLSAPTALTFGLWRGAELLDQKEILWQPQRHWQVDVVHGSHHDLGYTDIPSNILREHARHLDH